MKKILFLLLAVVSIGHAQETKIDSVVSVTFPGEAEVLTSQGLVFYRYVDSLGVLMFNYANVPDVPTVYPTAKKLKEFYEGFMDGVVKSTGGSDLRSKDVKLAGMKGLEFSFSVENKENGLTNLWYYRSFYIKGIVYSFIQLTFPGLAPESDAAREKFFSSLRINPAAGVKQTE